MRILTEVAQAGHRGWGPDCLHERAQLVTIQIASADHYSLLQDIYLVSES